MEHAMFLPFVPFIPYHNYNMNGYNADTGEMRFSPSEELTDAIVKHLNVSGVAVARRRDYVGAVGKDVYTLSAELKKVGIDGARTLYCLGLFPGCYVAIFGAPFNYATSELVMHLTLKNSTGGVLMPKEYKRSVDYKVGEYYNWNPLKFVGINLCDMMNEFTAEFEARIISPW